MIAANLLAPPALALVVPCFNEERRLDAQAFLRALRAQPGLVLVFCDDGSRDGTRARLAEIERAGDGRVHVVAQPRNRGKAEAVRAGVLAALELRPRFVGFWDADLATPLEALREFEALLEARPELEIVMAARVQLLGRRIARRTGRHYAGRLFATCVSLLLGLAVYDTQCGAKLFRVSAGARELFAEPFSTRWVFDVEILARRLRLPAFAGKAHPRDVVYELPLVQWTDVDGSKVRPRDFARSAIDVVRIWRRYF